MQEYIIGANGVWWHFFYKLGYGLCFRKKEGAFFGEWEILSGEAEQDFCALALGSSIHLVCQDHDGSILYFCFERGVWEKQTLLKSREKKPAPKHFRLVAISGSLNLFYVISYQDKTLLTHQFLNRPDATPEIVDSVTAGKNPYSIALHNGTELSLCYQNANGVCGIRSYRWSEKRFSPFFVLNRAEALSTPSIWANSDDSLCIAYVSRMESVRNLMLMVREPDGSLLPPSVLYLDCDASPAPVFSSVEGKLCLEWLDGGSVMYSFQNPENQKWRKPSKYMRSASARLALYHICQNGRTDCRYGSSDGTEIHLYGAPHLLDVPPVEIQKSGFRPEGADALDFARTFGYRRPEQSQDMDYDELQKEIALLRTKLDDHEKILSELSAIIHEKNLVPLVEDEADIDAVLLDNPPSSKIVVTGT